MSDERPEADAGTPGGRAGDGDVSLLPAGVAVATGVAGAALVSGGGRGGVSAGILLLIVALAAAGVAAGSRRFGPEAEGPLDLSARLALGLLGGTLAGLAHAALQRLAGVTGLLDFPGVGVDPGVTAAGWGERVWIGAALGLAYGVLLRRLPGRSHVARAAWLSAVPTLYLLLYHYPVSFGMGLFGVRLGLLTPVAAALLNLAAACVAGAVMAWGERTDEAPLSRPLVG